MFCCYVKPNQVNPVKEVLPYVDEKNYSLSSVDTKIYNFIYSDESDKTLQRIVTNIMDFQILKNPDILYIKQYIPKWGNELLTIHNRISQLMDTLFVKHLVVYGEKLDFPCIDKIDKNDIVRELTSINEIFGKLIIVSINENWLQ